MNFESLYLLSNNVPALMLSAGLAVLLTIALVGRVRLRQQQELDQRQRDMEERTRMLALYDSSTMMRNRVSFQQEIVGLIQRCQHSGEQFDLFYGSLTFNGISDDQVDEGMRALAERMLPLTRSGDLLARYSRTEFTLLRPRLHEADQPRNLREQLYAACALPVQIGEASIALQAHVGVGTYPADGTHSRQLLQAATRTVGVESAPAKPILISRGGLRAA